MKTLLIDVLKWTLSAISGGLIVAEKQIYRLEYGHYPPTFNELLARIQNTPAAEAKQNWKKGDIN